MRVMPVAVPIAPGRWRCRDVTSSLAAANLANTLQLVDAVKARLSYLIPIH